MADAPVVCPSTALGQRCSLGRACPWSHPDPLVSSTPLIDSNKSEPPLIIGSKLEVPIDCDLPSNLVLGAPARALISETRRGRRGDNRNRGSRRGQRYDPCRRDNNNPRDRRQDMDLLREFHNLIKRQLLDTYATRRGRLVDLASGKGGDFKKFMHLDLTRVWCSDISKDHLDEARYRLEMDVELKKWNNTRPKVSICELDLNVADDEHPFWSSIPVNEIDTISCFFAIHYFAASLNSLTTILTRAAGKLRPGGYLLGCCPDGDEILRLVNSSVYKTAEMTIELLPKKEGEEKDEANIPMVMTLKDSIIEAGSREYLMTRKLVNQASTAAGLTVESIDNFAIWLSSLSGPAITRMQQATPSIRETSLVNMSFVLRKPLVVYDRDHPFV